MHSRQSRSERGITLPELAVVIAVIGVLAGFAVPRFLASVERAKAAESFNFLATVRAAQQRHHVTRGSYASDLSRLDLELTRPVRFSVGDIVVPSGEPSLQTGWELTLTRVGESAGYGAYTVVFNHEGFDTAKSTVAAEVSVLPVASG